MATPQASSRLEMLQARFQQKQLQEKEQKLLQLYDQQQQRAYQVVQRNSAGSNHGSGVTQHTVKTTSSTSTTQGGKVRQMFDERRQTTVKGIDRSYPLEPIDNKPRSKQIPSNAMGLSKIGNGVTVNRQSVSIKRVSRSDVNSNINGKPIVSYHEEVTHESSGPDGQRCETRVTSSDDFLNDNHITICSTDSNLRNGNHTDISIMKTLDEDTIERNSLMAKVHLMQYDETLKQRVRNDLDSEQFPVDAVIDVPDRAPKRSVTRKLTQAEARLERFKNANAKKISVTRTGATTVTCPPKKTTPPPLSSGGRVRTDVTSSLDQVRITRSTSPPICNWNRARSESPVWCRKETERKSRSASAERDMETEYKSRYTWKTPEIDYKDRAGSLDRCVRRKSWDCGLRCCDRRGYSPGGLCSSCDRSWRARTLERIKRMFDPDVARFGSLDRNTTYRSRSASPSRSSYRSESYERKQVSRGLSPVRVSNYYEPKIRDYTSSVSTKAITRSRSPSPVLYSSKLVRSASSCSLDKKSILDSPEITGDTAHEIWKRDFELRTPGTDFSSSSSWNRSRRQVDKNSDEFDVEVLRRRSSSTPPYTYYEWERTKPVSSYWPIRTSYRSRSTSPLRTDWRNSSCSPRSSSLVRNATDRLGRSRSPVSKSVGFCETNLISRPKSPVYRSPDRNGICGIMRTSASRRFSSPVDKSYRRPTESSAIRGRLTWNRYKPCYTDDRESVKKLSSISDIRSVSPLRSESSSGKIVSSHSPTPQGYVSEADAEFQEIEMSNRLVEPEVYCRECARRNSGGSSDEILPRTARKLKAREDNVWTPRNGSRGSLPKSQRSRKSPVNENIQITNECTIYRDNEMRDRELSSTDFRISDVIVGSARRAVVDPDSYKKPALRSTELIRRAMRQKHRDGNKENGDQERISEEPPENNIIELITDTNQSSLELERTGSVESVLKCFDSIGNDSHDDYKTSENETLDCLYIESNRKTKTAETVETVKSVASKTNNKGEITARRVNDPSRTRKQTFVRLTDRKSTKKQILTQIPIQTQKRYDVTKRDFRSRNKMVIAEKSIRMTQLETSKCKRKLFTSITDSGTELSHLRSNVKVGKVIYVNNKAKKIEVESKCEPTENPVKRLSKGFQPLGLVKGIQKSIEPSTSTVKRKPDSAITINSRNKIPLKILSKNSKFIEGVTESKKLSCSSKCLKKLNNSVAKAKINSSRITKSPSPDQYSKKSSEFNSRNSSRASGPTSPSKSPDAIALSTKKNVKSDRGKAYNSQANVDQTTNEISRKNEAFVIEFSERSDLNDVVPRNKRPALKNQSVEKKQSATSGRPPSSFSDASSGLLDERTPGKGKMATKVKSKTSPTNTSKSNTDSLASCKTCSRRFAQDRIQLHEDICSKTGQKKRKKFDSMMVRVRGTELEPFVKKGLGKKQNETKSKKPELKSNWRRKHEDFINAIRSAKQVQAHLAAGGKLSDLPPPPVSDTSDYIQCPHCNRKFNEAAAERHIPKCQHMLHNKPSNSRAPPRPKR